MAYDERLADRVRALVPPGTPEVRMFGGLAFMVNTHLTVSASADGLLVSVADVDGALDRGAEPMRMGDRVMRGFVRVPTELVGTDDALGRWVAPAVAEAQGKPPKQGKKR